MEEWEEVEKIHNEGRKSRIKGKEEKRKKGKTKKSMSLQRQRIGNRLY